MRLTSLDFVLAAAAQVALLSALPLAPGLVAAAAADPIVPPPLNQAQVKYYAAHPDEYNAILARAPKARTYAAPAATTSAPAAVGTWTNLTHSAPAGALSNPLLLTDGSVIVHQYCSAHWYKLTPDVHGDYVNGTWSQIADAPWQPLYFASQILNDGRVVGNGGEYDGAQGCAAHWITGGGVYNPWNNTWTRLAPPTGWSTIGDAQSIILPNTRYMLANCCSTQQAILNPATLTWTTTGATKFDWNDEEGWALLQNGTVLTADAYVASGTCGVNTERYAPWTGAWTSAGSAAKQLSDCLSGGHLSYEVGPLVTRTNGTVVGFSGVTTGVAGTTLYNPYSGTWSAGPNLPTIGGQNYNLADAPAVMLPSGNIFFAASSGLFTAPTHYFEFTAGNTIVQRTDAAFSSGNPSYVVNFLLLPTGQVLQTDFSNIVQIYTPAGKYLAAWQPTVTSVPTTMTRGSTYTLSGTQLNGITHGVYGDDQQAATNFPLVQLTNKTTGRVVYARSFGFTNRGITPNLTSSANFTAPPATMIPAGSYSLKVIANGIPSAATDVTLN